MFAAPPPHQILEYFPPYRPWLNTAVSVGGRSPGERSVGRAPTIIPRHGEALGQDLQSKPPSCRSSPAPAFPILSDSLFPKKPKRVEDEQDAASKDPLAAEVWRLYTKAKDNLPNGMRLENLTWRMMAMTLGKTKKGTAGRRTIDDNRPRKNTGERDARVAGIVPPPILHTPGLPADDVPSLPKGVRAVFGLSPISGDDPLISPSQYSELDTIRQEDSLSSQDAASSDCINQKKPITLCLPLDSRPMSRTVPNAQLFSDQLSLAGNHVFFDVPVPSADWLQSEQPGYLHTAGTVENPGARGLLPPNVVTQKQERRRLRFPRQQMLQQQALQPVHALMTPAGRMAHSAPTSAALPQAQDCREYSIRAERPNSYFSAHPGRLARSVARSADRNNAHTARSTAPVKLSAQLFLHPTAAPVRSGPRSTVSAGGHATIGANTTIDAALRGPSACGMTEEDGVEADLSAAISVPVDDDPSLLFGYSASGPFAAPLNLSNGYLGLPANAGASSSPTMFSAEHFRQNAEYPVRIYPDSPDCVLEDVVGPAGNSNFSTPDSAFWFNDFLALSDGTPMSASSSVDELSQFFDKLYPMEAALGSSVAPRTAYVDPHDVFKHDTEVKTTPEREVRGIGVSANGKAAAPSCSRASVLAGATEVYSALHPSTNAFARDAVTSGPAQLTSTGTEEPMSDGAQPRRSMVPPLSAPLAPSALPTPDIVAVPEPKKYISAKRQRLQKSKGSATSSAALHPLEPADSADQQVSAEKPAGPTCSNCATRTTPLWRRDPEGQPLCNACGLFFKLHGVVRPLRLKTNVIRKRNRGGGGGSVKHPTGTANASAAAAAVASGEPAAAATAVNRSGSATLPTQTGSSCHDDAAPAERRGTSGAVAVPAPPQLVTPSLSDLPTSVPTTFAALTGQRPKRQRRFLTEDSAAVAVAVAQQQQEEQRRQLQQQRLSELQHQQQCHQRRQQQCHQVHRHQHTEHFLQEERFQQEHEHHRRLRLHHHHEQQQQIDLRQQHVHEDPFGFISFF